ncbi:MAG: hypothetical protein AB1801_08605 [Chloroflexota bacterium]
MDHKTEQDEPGEQAERPYLSSRPPIFALYDLFRRQPVLLGAGLGLLAGLVLAAQTGLRTETALIGGAVVGTGLAAIILRLWARQKK